MFIWLVTKSRPLSLAFSLLTYTHSVAPSSPVSVSPDFLPYTQPALETVAFVSFPQVCSYLRDWPKMHAPKSHNYFNLPGFSLNVFFLNPAQGAPPLNPSLTPPCDIFNILDTG